MKQISVYDFYALGEALQPLLQWTEDTPKSKVVGQARRAYRQLIQAADEDSVMLPGSREAAKGVIRSLEAVFGEEISKFGYIYDSPVDPADESPKLGIYARLPEVAIYKFETIFRSDLPRMTVFGAEQKGLYQTERLIDNAEDHFPTSIRNRIPKQAKVDLHFAGKCLAFDTPTACAFHVWRALEIVFGAYYISITSRAFADDKVQRNWRAYIVALEKVGADKKITGNLDHIRAHYRNPIMHPNENVTDDEAFNLFGIGTSVITQVMQAIETQPYADKALASETIIKDEPQVEGWV